jgi:hypothetical protein
MFGKAKTALTKVKNRGAILGVRDRIRPIKFSSSAILFGN